MASRSTSAGASAILFLACLAALGCGRPHKTSRAALASRYEATRPVEGRLTGGFRHAPYQQVPRAAAPNPTAPELVRSRGKPAEEQRAGAALADRGVMDLWDGDTDRAVVWLAEATRREPREAGHWSDLAAAFLERSRVREEAHDLVPALAAARRALSLDSNLSEAWFNRALALDGFALRDEAVAAWADCLAHSPGAGWREEVTARRQTLLQPTSAESWRQLASQLDRAAGAGDTATVHSLVARFQQPARERAEEELLPTWARAFVDGRAGDAARLLVAARSVGAALAALHGEHMVADAVAAIDAALSTPADRSRVLALAEGHLAVREGRELLERREIRRARERLHVARDHLRQGGSPFVAWADVYLAVCAYDSDDSEAAFGILDTLLHDPAAGRSPSLLGHAAWIGGLTRFRSADPSAALADYARALAQFERGGELENQGAVHTMFAEALVYLGEDREAWRHRARALSLLSSMLKPKRRQATLEEAEIALTAEGELATALIFRESAVREARRLGDAVSVSFALLRRAVLRHRLGDGEGAARDLEEAGRLVGKVPEGLRQRIDAELALAEGEVGLHDRPKHAAERLGDALTYFRATGDGVRALEVYPRRALAYRAAGDEARAEADLTAGVVELERQRDAVSDEGQRAAYFARAQPLFDQRIALAMRRGETAHALDDSERARARTLLDRLAAGKPGERSGPLTSGLLPPLLPAGVAVIEYSVLEDRLFLWVIRRGGIEAVTIETPEARLTEWVSGLRAALVGGFDGADVRRLSGRIYAAVVGPALAHTVPGEALVFVPDKALHALPFAALIDPATGHFLIQDHPLSIAPSASLYVKALERDRQLAAHVNPGALLVGDPAFDQALFPGLRRLPEARREVAELAQLYPPGQARVLQDGLATKVRFLEELNRYGIVQFSGHSQIDAERPELSRLALAPEEGDSGVLYARDLRELRSEATRLVVLAACSTGLRETAGAEGVSSLTRAFLAAGIPMVVASLWDVRDDSATSRLLLMLHQRLLAGESPLYALRQAQLSLLADADPQVRAPRNWAAFELFGGVSPDLSVPVRR
jgi:CHAT domain-containing protein